VLIQVMEGQDQVRLVVYVEQRLVVLVGQV
jgi:hypothetical protein